MEQHKVVVMASSAGTYNAVTYLLNKINLSDCSVFLSPHIQRNELKEFLDDRIGYTSLNDEDIPNCNFEKGKVYIHEELPVDPSQKGIFRTSHESELGCNIAMVQVSERYKDSTIGVVLTGATDDGAYGLEVIKKNGGTIMAQSRPSRKYHLFHRKSIGIYVSGMPDAAKERNELDYFRPLPELAQKINKLISTA